MKILIVDDYPGAVEASRILLELLGHECAVAMTGQGALAEVERFDPDMLLLDIGLPDLSGYEVARMLRARTSRKRIFIVALSGWARVEDRVQSLAAGIDAHIEKPPSREVLEALVRKATALAAPSADASADR